MVLAVGITRPGGPEVLSVIERDVPPPGEGEVRIRVHAAAVHPSDIAFRTRGIDGVPPPWVPGWDAGGTIESVGPGVEGHEVGEEVMAVVGPRRPAGGAQSQLIVALAASVVAPPDGITLEQAATLPMNGLTALRALELLDLEPGSTLLVTGGAGLLASIAIPVAKRTGLRVLADASEADAELVRGYGPDDVLPRGDGLVAAVREVVPGGVDAVLDTAVLGRAIFPAIRERGQLAYVRTWDGDDVENGITIRRVWVGDVLERTDWLLQLRELVEDGAVTLRVVARFAPDQAAEAHRLMEAGGLRGRALIVFD